MKLKNMYVSGEGTLDTLRLKGSPEEFRGERRGLVITMLTEFSLWPGSLSFHCGLYVKYVC